MILLLRLALLLVAVSLSLAHAQEDEGITQEPISGGDSQSPSLADSATESIREFLDLYEGIIIRNQGETVNQLLGKVRAIGIRWRLGEEHRPQRAVALVSELYLKRERRSGELSPISEAFLVEVIRSLLPEAPVGEGGLSDPEQSELLKESRRFRVGEVFAKMEIPEDLTSKSLTQLTHEVEQKISGYFLRDEFIPLMEDLLSEVGKRNLSSATEDYRGRARRGDLPMTQRQVLRHLIFGKALARKIMSLDSDEKLDQFVTSFLGGDLSGIQRTDSEPRKSRFFKNQLQQFL